MSKKVATELKISLESVEITLASVSEPVSAYELVPIMITFEYGCCCGLENHYCTVSAHESLGGNRVGQEYTDIYERKEKWRYGLRPMQVAHFVKSILCKKIQDENLDMICALKTQREDRQNVPVMDHITATGLRRKKEEMK